MKNAVNTCNIWALIITLFNMQRKTLHNLILISENETVLSKATLYEVELYMLYNKVTTTHPCLSSEVSDLYSENVWSESWLDYYHGGFSWFSQFHHACTRLVKQIRTQLFPCTFHIPYNQSSYHMTLYNLMNWQHC